MAVFKFRAKKEDGGVIAGNLTAKSKKEVEYILNSKRLTPILISQKKDILNNKAGTFFGAKVSTKHLVTFTRQLSFLINAGVPITQSLSIVKQICFSSNLRLIISNIRDNIEKGQTFGQALGQYSNLFGKVFISIVSAGEDSGQLDKVLKQVAQYMEDNKRLKDRVKKAMMYPAFVLTAGIGVFMAIMIFLVPKFVEMFESSSVELPVATRLLISISDFIQTNWIMLIILMVIAPFVLITYLRSPSGQELKDYILMITPIFGDLAIKNSTSLFSRTMNCLLSGGVNMVDALSSASSAANNVFIEKAVLRSRTQVLKGKSLAESLKKEKHIPVLLSNMIAIGEETGNVDATLEKVAEYYEEQVNATTSAISDLIQPFLIVALGCLVGFIVVALYLPIFKMPGVAGGM